MSTDEGTHEVVCSSIINTMVEHGALPSASFDCRDCGTGMCMNPMTNKPIKINGPTFKALFRSLAVVHSKQPDTAMIKQSISKSANVFHLPMQLSVIVPSTAEVDGELSRADFHKRVVTVERWLGNTFGGYTAITADGGYVARENEAAEPYLVKEPVVKVTSNATSSDVYTNIHALMSQLRHWANEWGQEAMGFEFEGDLFYVDRDH